MKRMERDDGKGTADLEQLLAGITTGAHGDDEQLWAFHRALRDGIELPCDAFVIGEPVQVITFDRMLWFNPSDNQGVRFLIKEVRAKTAWEDRA